MLGADAAELHGDQIKTEDQGGQAEHRLLGQSGDWVSWKVNFPRPAPSRSVPVSRPFPAPHEFVVEAAVSKSAGWQPQTAGWDEFKEINLGRLEVKQPGQQEVKIRAQRPPELAGHEPALCEAHESGIAISVEQPRLGSVAGFG